MTFYETLNLDEPTAEQDTERVQLDETIVNTERIMDILTSERTGLDSTQIKKLAFILENLKSGKKTTYFKSEKTGRFGRRFSSNGIQNLFFKLRNYICHDIMTDIDMVNAHPVILRHICQEMGWKCKALNDYVENRDIHIKSVMDHYGVKRDDAKRLFISLIYGGGFRRWVNDMDFDEPKEPIQFITEFLKEMKNIINFHYNTDAIGVEIAKQDNKKTEVEKKNSALSITINDIEDRILMAIKKCIDKNLKHLTPRVLMFDGIMTSGDVSDDDISKMENYILKMTGFKINLSIKPMNDRYEIEPKKNIDFKFLDPVYMDSLNYYGVQKTYFEKYISCIEYPSMFMLEMDNEVKFLNNTTSLKNSYGAIKSIVRKMKKGEMVEEPVSFVDLWLKDVQKRQYHAVQFRPYGAAISPRNYNLFKGYYAETIQPNEDSDPSITEDVYEHIKKLCENNEDHKNWLLKYLAYILKKPAERCQVALVFKGKQGDGKSMFFEFFGRLIGMDYFISSKSIETLCGRFANLSNKLLVCHDETSGKDTFANEGDLKNKITDPTLRVEMKGIQETESPNYTHLVFLSNNDTPVKVDQGDRRFVIFHTTSFNGDKDEKDIHFTKLSALFNNDKVIRQFYDELMEIDVSDFHPWTTRPITDEYLRIQEATKSVYQVFIEDIQSGQNHNIKAGLNNSYNAFDFYKEFKEWYAENGYKPNDLPNSVKFGRSVKTIESVICKRVSKGNVYSIMPLLDDDEGEEIQF